MTLLEIIGESQRDDVLARKKKAWRHIIHQAREAYSPKKTDKNARATQGLSTFLSQIFICRQFGLAESGNPSSPLKGTPRKQPISFTP
jgi:hypothetical protein